jgi:hypothetical protein
MPPLGIELVISTGERPQTYALDRAATGIGTGDLDGLGEKQKKPPNIDLEFGINGNEDDNQKGERKNGVNL